MTGRPAHWANDAGTAFKNPWPSAAGPTWMERQQFAFPLSWYKPHKHDTQHEVKIVTPDWGEAALEEKSLDRSNAIIGTWLGHASALVELPLSTSSESSRSLHLLFDAIFSHRAGPAPYIGPARFNPPPCSIDDLPGCDAVLISHNHYDHLDYSTIESLLKKFPKALYFAALRNKPWFVSCGIPADQIFELDWWDEHVLDLSAPSSFPSQKVTVTCVPAQHNSGRTGLDAASTLWCGWIIQSTPSPSPKTPNPKKTTIYHAGDTGLRRTSTSTVTCPIFPQLGTKFGPIDLSFVPIWRGGTLGFVSYYGLKLNHADMPAALHASPGDAVAIHEQVRSRNTVGVHWGTFVGSESEQHEAWAEFEGGVERRGSGSWRGWVLSLWMGRREKSKGGRER